MTSSSQECLSKSGLVISEVFLKDMEVPNLHAQLSPRFKAAGVECRYQQDDWMER